jgi:hypothetical protein
MLLFDQINLPDSNSLYGSAFRSFYQPIKSVPFFGSYYNQIVPLFIVLIGGFTLFKSVQKVIKNIVGERLDFDNVEVNEEKVRKGRNHFLLEYARMVKRRKIEEYKSQNEKNSADKISVIQLINSPPEEISRPDLSQNNNFTYSIDGNLFFSRKYD